MTDQPSAPIERVGPGDTTGAPTSRFSSMSRRAVNVGLGSSVALIAAACSSGAAEPAKTPAPAAPAAPAAGAATKAPDPTKAPEPAKAAEPTKAAAPAAAPAAGGAPKVVARKDTFVLGGFGAGATEITDPDNINPYSLGGLGRVRGLLNLTMYEFLYLYNHNDGSEIPWLAESYKVAPDFKSVDVKIRKGVEWNDGKPFTSGDVKYTLELLRDTPELVFASDIKEWVKDVAVKDDQNFTINLNKPNVRFFYFYFVENSEIHIPILPKHIWEKEKVGDFKGSKVGTGPYIMVAATGQRQDFDRNDNWWAAKSGFQKLPKPLRVSAIPPGAGDTAVAREINNEFDAGNIMQPGVFEAASAKNKDVISWSTKGPAWGAPDACMYTLGLNTKYGPMADVHVRRAVQASINRAKVVDLAYEGSTVPLVLPFSTYGGLTPYTKMMQPLIDKYKPDNPSAEVIASEMAAAGYKKEGANWTKDGKKLTFQLLVPGWLKPMGPVVEKQLRDGGFDVTFKLFDPDTQPFFDTVRAGNADAWIIVHCGSSREPWGTLQHYHSKFASSEQGKQNSYIWANSQYSNKEYDAIIDQMDQVLSSPTDAKYTDLVTKAVDIFLKDVVEITISEERHVVTNNQHYWKGFMTTENAYAAPYSLWAAWLQVLLKVEPTGAA